MKKEEMYLSYIKFKNFLVVDLSTGNIIFDMMNVRVILENYKFYIFIIYRVVKNIKK
jgi:hypothetical protein